MDYLSQMKNIAPECVLTVVAFVVLVFDMATKGRNSKRVGYVTLAGLAVTGWFLLKQWAMLRGLEGGALAEPVFAMVKVDLFGTFFKLFTVGSLIIVTLFVLCDRTEREHGVGEYYFLLLGAAIGIFFMVSTNNLLLLMLGLELLSLASYSLAGFHKSDKRSGEAAMKYVIFGGLSAGIMLYGISLLYGLTGTIDLEVMGRGASEGFPVSLAAQFAESPVPVAIAVVLVLSGFAYKVSIVPFHFWVPDVYEGAPTPVTTFLAVASKAAGFAALLRFVGALFMVDGVDQVVRDYGDRIGLLLAILAAATMTLGNLSALRQASLKRLLAYSSIAHAGYVLMGLACMTVTGFSAAMFYLAAYYFMNLGAFGFLLYFQGVTGKEDIESLRGMGWKAPVVSWTMVIFLISLTGLPPTIGFFGKYLLFLEGIRAGLGWLVVVAALNAVISLFYYFRVVKALFLAGDTEAEARPQPFFVGLLALLGAGTVVGGLYNEPLQDWVDSSQESLGIVNNPVDQE
ncbi:MAG: NADH-quinone oxidoreductase subunit N [Planctomycetota bacterium]|nr:NADH-quinone oxidoreductase subunit N [Planctomycetota bacterium]